MINGTKVRIDVVSPMECKRAELLLNSLTNASVIMF